MDGEAFPWPHWHHARVHETNAGSAEESGGLGYLARSHPSKTAKGGAAVIICYLLRREDEQSSSSGRYAKGRIHSYVGWKARQVGSQWAAVCGLGTLSPEGIAGGSESDLCIADERLVWAGDSAFR